MGLSGAGPRARRAARSFASGLGSAGHAGASTARGTERVIRRLTRASGADRTGLDRLLELTAAGAAADAFVAVALAGTLFFSTSVDQARGRIALTLLITMAPFAVLAPFIGPMLDRVRDGRRYIMLGTLLARGLLCWGMAGAAQHNDTLTLLPAAFGVLVLQKAYGVTRSAVTPRLLPAKITLVSANARISLASLIASAVGVGAAGAVSLLAGGGSTGAAWVLRVGTVVYLAAIALGIRLPNRVDEAAAPTAADPSEPTPHRAAPHAAGPRPDQAGPNGPHGAGGHAAHPYRPSEYPTVPHTVRRHQPPPHQAPAAGHPGNGHPGHAPNGHPGNGHPGNGHAAAGHPAATQHGPKRAKWAMALRSVGPIVGEAMRGNAALRAFSGYMIFFLAFLLRTEHFAGTPDKVALAEMIAAAGAGGFIGTGIGTLLRARAPHLIMFTMLCISTVVTAACAVFFGLWAALIVALVAASGQVLAKLALDSIVQREIPEQIRSSTLAASETIHQLAWVVGGLAGLAMSIPNSGVAGLAVAAAGLAITTVALIVARRRRILAGRRMTPHPATR
jgi:Major Facilitator Superfamily